MENAWPIIKEVGAYKEKIDAFNESYLFYYRSNKFGKLKPAKLNWVLLRDHDKKGVHGETWEACINLENNSIPWFIWEQELYGIDSLVCELKG